MRPEDGLYWPLAMQVVDPLGSGAALSVMSASWRTCVGADITDVGDKLAAKILLNEQVPAFDVAAAEVCGVVLVPADRKRGKAVGEVGDGRGGNADGKGQRQIALCGSTPSCRCGSDVGLERVQWGTDRAGSESCQDRW